MLKDAELRANSIVTSLLNKNAAEYACFLCFTSISRRTTFHSFAQHVQRDKKTVRASDAW